MGRVSECPYGQEIDELREQVYVLFEKAGEEPRKKESSRPSSAFLRQTSDPEKGLAEFAEGVRVGVGFKVPRVPAVYPRRNESGD